MGGCVCRRNGTGARAALTKYRPARASLYQRPEARRQNPSTTSIPFKPPPPPTRLLISIYLTLHPLSMESQSRRVLCFDVTEDTPKPGVTFYDQAPLLKDPYTRRKVTKEFVRHLRGLGVNTVVGLEARGFSWAQALADELRISLVLARKKGKLHGACHETSYSLEYNDGETLVMQKSAMNRHARVVIVDDVLATGGTAAAAARLVRMAGATVLSALFVLRMTHLGGVTTLRKETGEELHVYAAYEADGGGNVVQTPKSPYQLPGMGETALDSVSEDPIDDKRVIVMWNESCALQALELISQHPDRFRPVPIKWGTFPDESSDIEFSNIGGGGEEFRGKHVVYFASSVTHEELLRSLQMLTVLPRQGIESLVVPMMYMGSSTHERVTREGVVASAEPYALLLDSAMKPKTRTGPADLILYDIHAPSVRFYFGDEGRLLTPGALSMFLSKLRGIPTPVGGSGPREIADPYGVIFPDLGAFKRFAHEDGVGGVPTIICAKQRGEDGERRVCIANMCNVPEAEEERLAMFKKLRWVICDDLVHSGNTAYECAKELRKIGFDKLEFYATHAVFENLAWMDFLPGGSKAVFDRIHVTSSVPSVAMEHLSHYGEMFTVTSLTDDILKHAVGRIPALADTRRPLRVTEAQLARVAFETNSPCKVKAFKELFPHAIQTAPLDQSDYTEPVPPQPVGQDMIDKGCARRCLWAASHTIGAGNKAHAAIAAESGLSSGPDGDGAIYDITTVRVELVRSTAPVYQASVRGPRVPKRVVEQVMRAELQKTAGEFIAEMFPEQRLDHRDWYNVKYRSEDFEGESVPFNPAEDMCQHSRSELIRRAIKKALECMNKDVNYDMSVKYPGH